MYTLDIHVHVKVFSIDIVQVVFNIIYSNTCTHWIYMYMYGCLVLMLYW